MEQRRWSSGNDFTLLENGEEFFPRVFACIANARREVIVESFILFEDKVGLQLQEALIAAARRGAQVDITVDDWGSPDLSEHFLATLRAAGVRIHSFNPGPRPFGLRPHLLREPRSQSFDTLERHASPDTGPSRGAHHGA